MTPIRMKIIGAGVAIVGAAAVLAFSGMRDGWVYFLPVDEFVASEHRWDERVRLHGRVGEDQLTIDRAGLSAGFQLCGTTKAIPVHYTGVIPEMFDAGRDVVVEGTRDANGVFCADTLMTKCASKYESGGEAPHADPHLKNQADAAGSIVPNTAKAGSRG
ncbi:MAG: cytochrome c maturation protein CcmE [Phycisphaerae bacterium]|jgi:cytochrome c-type biogenesis protein CcmE|nr:cytochrome c maturation protein CcmE [Phycisphaerae bacterium]